MAWNCFSSRWTLWRIRPRCTASIWLHWHHSYFIYIWFPYCTVIFNRIWHMQIRSYQKTICHDRWYYSIYLLLYISWIQCTCYSFNYNGDLARFSLFKRPHVYGETRIGSDGHTIFTIRSVTHIRCKLSTILWCYLWALIIWHAFISMDYSIATDCESSTSTLHQCTAFINTFSAVLFSLSEFSQSIGSYHYYTFT